MPPGIVHVTINILLTVVLVFTIFDIFPDLDHAVTVKGISLKTRVIELGKGFLGMKHEVAFNRGILHNFYIWFSIFIIGLLGLVHLLVDRLR